MNSEEIALLIGSLQAQVDELQESVLKLRNDAGYLYETLWNLTTAIEWLVDDTTRPGMVRERVLVRVAEATRSIEELQENE